MADKLANGSLADIIVARRIHGKEPLERIARDLYADYGIEVTRQTLAKWELALTEQAGAA